MKATTAVLLTFVGMILLFGIGGAGCVLSTLNKEIDLRTRIQAKSTSNEATLDTMWKTIKQKANISEQAVSQIRDLNKIYSEIVEGRSGGTLFKMVTENYPDLGQKEVAGLYREIMASVEAERKVFKRDQTQLVDFNRERDAFIQKPVSKMILNGFGGDTVPFKRKGALEAEGWPEDHTYVFVTSSATQTMAATGAEDDIDLFKEQKK